MLDIYLNLLIMTFAVDIEVFVYSALWLKVCKRVGCSRKHVTFANLVWKYSKPWAFIGTFAIPALVVLVDGHLSGSHYFDFVVNLGALYLFKDSGDDDFTKKLKKKLKEKVEVLKGKLIVVPEAA